MGTTHTIAAALSAGLVSVSTSHAQYVYDNNAGGASGISGATVSDNTILQQLADGVSFDTDTDVTGIEWTGLYLFGNNAPDIPDNFLITIFSDAAGIPDIPLATFTAGASVARLDSGFDAVGSDVYAYEYALSFTFLGGVDYWISVENSYAGDNDLWAWGVGNPGTDGPVYDSGDSGLTWSPLITPGTDFRLIPSPSGAALLTLGALALIRRRR